MVTGAFILRRSSPLRPFLNSHVSNILNQNYFQTGWSMICKKRCGIAFPYRAKATAQIISIFGQISQNSDTLIHLPGLQQLLGFPCMRQFTAARNTTSAAAGRSASSTPSRRFCSCCFKAVEAVKAVQPSLIFRCSRFKSIRKCAPCFFGVFNLSSSPF